MTVGSPLAFYRLVLLIGTAPDPHDPDIDELDFRDPRPNPEELLIAAEEFLGRGFWSTTKDRPPADVINHYKTRKKWRPTTRNG